MSERCPCYGCEERYVGCKSDCKEYPLWKKRHEDEKKRIYENKEKARIVEVYRSTKKK